MVIKEKHFTSIEEGRKLVCLGLNPNSADFHYTKGENIRGFQIITLSSGGPCAENQLPCWSDSALFDMMPIIISNDTAFEGEDAEGISTTYCKYLSQCEDGMYECKYKDNNCGATLKRFKASTMFEVIYDMVVWLLENKYLQVV